MVRQALIILTILVIPNPSWGEDCGPQDYDADRPPDFECPSPGESDLVPRLNAPSSLSVEQGERVEIPFTGAVVARERLMAIGLRLQAVRRLRWLDRLQLRQRADIERVADTRVHEARQQQLVAHRDYYRTLAEQRGESAWYRSYWFGFLCGAVVAVVLAGVAIYGIGELGRASHAY